MASPIFCQSMRRAVREESLRFVVMPMDLLWRGIPQGQAIASQVIRVRAGLVRDFSWADLVPHGPLSLPQALHLLEGLTNPNSELQALAEWAAFLAPDSSTQLQAVKDVWTKRDPAREIEKVRELMPLLSADLRACWPAGALKHPIASALASLYLREPAKWRPVDNGLLADAAGALEIFLATPEAKPAGYSFGLPGFSDEHVTTAERPERADARRALELIRQRLDAERKLRTAERQARDQQQQGVRERRASHDCAARRIAVPRSIPSMCRPGSRAL